MSVVPGRWGFGKLRVNLGRGKGGGESEFREDAFINFTRMVGPASFVRAMGQGGGHGFRMNDLRLRQCGSSSRGADNDSHERGRINFIQ